MKSSMILAVTGAVSVMAAAIDRRAIETQWDVKWVTVTVTRGQEPAAATSTRVPGQFYEIPGHGRHGRPNSPSPSFTTIKPTPTPQAEAEDESEADNNPPPPPPPTTTTTTAQPPQETPADEDDSDSGDAPSGDFQESALNAHNIHRREHKAPDLKWGSKYADYARQSAEKCVFAHDLTPGGGGYGQNLAMWGATDGDDLGEATAIHEAASDMWYKGEVNLYKWYGKEPVMDNFSDWGHFSQLVWVDTTEVGCHVAFCPKGTMNPNMGIWYSVCNYFPAGNVDKHYADNVKSNV